MIGQIDQTPCEGSIVCSLLYKTLQTEPHLMHFKAK